jgi:hypothetical protein
MIKNACPFAPGEVKPDSIPTSSNNQAVLKRVLNKRNFLLVLSLVFLTVLYTLSYSNLKWEGSSVLYQDWYIVKMSFYTYAMSLISFFIRENRRKKG